MDLLAMGVKDADLALTDWVNATENMAKKIDGGQWPGG
jgi:hypothetical protein